MLTARTFRRWPVAVAVIAVLVVASNASAAPASQSARSWSKDVCTAVGDWNAALESAASAVTVDAASPPAEVKAALTKLLKKMRRATKQLVASVDDAGEPAVRDGSQVAKAVHDAVDGVAASLQTARDGLAQASTDDPVAFTAVASAANDALTTALSTMETTFDAAGVLDSPKLLAAMRTVRACRTATPS